MEIIKIFNKDFELFSDEGNLIQGCQKGKWSDWTRTFLLRDLTNGKIAVISLNLFERIAWTLQSIFFCSPYSKFETVFNEKNIKIISPSDLKETEEKVNNQFLNQQKDQKADSDAGKVKNPPSDLDENKASSVSVNQNKDQQPASVTQKGEISLTDLDKDNTPSAKQNKNQQANPDAGKVKNPPSDLAQKVPLSQKGNEPKHDINISQSDQNKLPDHVKNNIQIVPSQPLLSQDQIVRNFIKDGHYQKAIEANKIVVIPFEKNFNYLKIAETFLFNKGLQEVTKFLDEEVKIKDVSDDVYCTFIYFSFQNERYQECIEAFKKKTNNKSDIIAYFLTCAKECYENKNYDKAVKMLDELDKSDPSYFLPVLTPSNQKAHRENEDLYLLIVKDYIHNQDLDKAVILLDKISYNKEEKYRLLNEIWKEYKKQSKNNKASEVKQKMYDIPYIDSYKENLMKQEFENYQQGR